MRVTCVGGGPAGLYFSICSKLLNPAHQVSVLERNPPAVTQGWGVTFSDDLLDDLYRTDPVTARQIAATPRVWTNQEVHVGPRRAHLGGYGYAMGRQELLDILLERAVQLGVDVQFGREVRDVAELADADLVVAADGASSALRQADVDGFGTRAAAGRNKYLWLGTRRRFDSFMYAFEPTSAGWIWFYSYPFSAQLTTVVVECSTQTWTGVGLDRADPSENLAALEKIFARHLAGYRLLYHPQETTETPWRNFTRIRNGTWHRNNVVLVGDAAHTTHFSVGSGTTLAMQDAMALARGLHAGGLGVSGLAQYCADRQAAMAPMAFAADLSAQWFERVDRRIDQPITGFAYDLWRRRGPAPPWRYQAYLATQIAPLRRARRTISTLRNGVRAQRRLAGVPQTTPAGGVG